MNKGMTDTIIFMSKDICSYKFHIFLIFKSLNSNEKYKVLN